MTVFTGRTRGIAIRGNNTSDGSIVIQCNEGAGLMFVECENIALSNLVLSGCGYLHNSTSRDFDSHGFKFLLFHTSLYFLFCVNVNLSYVSVRDSNSTGVVMYNTVGNNVIEHSEVINNQYGGSHSSGGGLYIEFSYCNPQNVSCSDDTGSNVPTQYTTDSNYIISSTLFKQNKAHVSDSELFSFILPQKSNHLAFGRGGGISVFFKGRAANNTVMVNHCILERNVALWGGGIFVEHQDWSTNNSFNVYGSLIEDNMCLNDTSSSAGTGGGGSRVGYIFFYDTHARNNSIHFEKCNISMNTAYFGGGISFYAAREPSESQPTNLLSFVNCNFYKNVARAGSAADLAVWHSVARGATAEAYFTDCKFYQNYGNYTRKLGTVEGIGAMYVDSIPVFFQSSVTFEDNTHSALAAVSTGVYIAPHTTVQFYRNSGRAGAAVALLGYAFIEASDGSKFLFFNNTAEIKGGAIRGESIGEHDLISSRNCFIRYNNINVQPENWTAEFVFSNNMANGERNSIYATSLLSCIWGGAYGSTTLDSSKVFCWNNTWIYASGDCLQEIQTAPAGFNQSFNISLVPGKRVRMPISVHDDRNVMVTNSTVFIARSSSSDVVIGRSAYYVSDNSIEVHSNVSNSSVNVFLSTIEPRIIHTTLNVTILRCPPGLSLNHSDNTAEASCVCIGDRIFDGRVICNGATFSSRLQRGAWIGKFIHKGEEHIVAQDCPFCLSISNHRYFDLPAHVQDLDEYLCGKINRRGRLCGECKERYGPAVNTFDYTCVKCDSKKWLLYLATEFFPITVFFVLVILFDIRATTAAANGFIFFAQVVPVAFTLNGNGVIELHNVNSVEKLQDVYIILYDIWNLNYFRPIQPPYCFNDKIGTLKLISMGYLTAVYPLLLIVVVSLCVWLYECGFKPALWLGRPIHWGVARFQQVWNIERSLIHAFATFILLSYTKFALISFLSLTNAPLVNATGDSIGSGVVYYEGTIPFFSSRHIPFVALAIIVLLTFVSLPPILLSIPSLLHNLQKCSNFCAPRTKLQQLLNAFNTPKLRWILNLFHNPKLQQFLDAFHGCYKDRTEKGCDYRWFAGLYFILRAIIFAVFPFTRNLMMLYVFIQFLCIASIIVFLIFRPYKEDFYNKLDALMFCLLVSINTLTMYNYHIVTIGSNPSENAFYIQYILMLLPILYATCIVVLYMYRKCLAMKCRKSTFARSDHEEEDEDLEAGERTDLVNEGFLTFAQSTGRMHAINRYQPASVASTNCNEPALSHSTRSSQLRALAVDDSSKERVEPARGGVPAETNKLLKPRKNRRRSTSGYGSVSKNSVVLQSMKSGGRFRSRSTWSSSGCTSHSSSTKECSGNQNNN